MSKLCNMLKVPAEAAAELEAAAQRLRGGDARGALALFEALAVRPGCGEAGRRGRALALQRLGRPQEAAALLQEGEGERKPGQGHDEDEAR